MLRTVNILASQIRNRSLLEVARFFTGALFKHEPILIYRRELGSADDSGNRAHAAEIAQGNTADLEILRKSQMPAPWEFSCDLHDRVKDFFIARRSGAIAHISWIYYKNDPNRLIELFPDEAEIKYALTLPEFRGQGFYPATLIKIQEFLRARGYMRVFICAREDNRSSIRGIEKAGFHYAAKIGLVKILGVQVSKRYASGH